MRRQKAAAPVLARPVNYVVVAPITIETFGSFAGTVEPRYEAKLGFQIAGRMVSRDANVGDMVKAGQRLATLDAKVPAFALSRPGPLLPTAKARRPMPSARPDARKSWSGKAGPRRRTSRLRRLPTTRLPPGWSKRRPSCRKPRTSSATPRSKLFAGVVTNWSVEVAQVVSAGQSVVTVARPDIEEAVVDIPDALIARVHPDEAFTVTLKAVPGITAQGRVREIAPQSDAATRTRRVRITLENPPQAFRLGTTVTVAPDRNAPSRITLPASAVRDRDGHGAVWVIKASEDGSSANGTVRSRDVALEGATPNEVTVATGLDRGDKVVTAGADSLSEGQAVRLGQRL